MKPVVLFLSILFFFTEIKAQEKHPVFHNDTIQKHKDDSMNKEKKKRADSMHNKEKRTRVDTSFGKPKVKKDSVSSEMIIPRQTPKATFFCMPAEDDVLRLVFLIIWQDGPGEIQGFLDIADMNYDPE